MGFKWGGAGSGALKGGIAGSYFGPIGAAFGAGIGGITGGFGKDIDKKVTGNSGSGLTQNALTASSILGGGASLLTGKGMLGGLMKGGATAGASGGSPLSYLMPGGNMNVAAGQFSNPLMSTSQAGLGQQTATSGFGLSGLGSKLKSNPLLLGSGLMGASQLIRSPKVPELPQSVVDYQNAARQGNPLQNQASQALSQQLSQTQQNMGQDEIDALNRQYDLAQENELKSIDSMYKSLRPGSDPLTDSSYQRDLGRVRDRYATLRADSQAQMQRQISNDFASQRGQQIAQAAGLGNDQLQQLAQLSQYDLDRALDQMAMDYNDKSQLRNYILQLGGNIAASGFQQQPLFASPYGG